MKSIVNTIHAPAPIGPYNQAVAANGMLFVSGQIALNPSNGELVNDTLEHETIQVLENLKAVLEAGGSNLDSVLKCTIFLTDMANFAIVNEVYARYFRQESAPARETVAVKALPRYVNVEIGCVALIKA